MKDLKGILKSKNSSLFLIIAGFLGILLLSFPQTPKEESKERTNFDAASYVLNLEEKLKNVLENIEGVGEVKVMITLEGEGEVIYAQDQKENTDIAYGDNGRKSFNWEKNYVFMDGGANREALKISGKEPIVRGVIIVCKGGGDYKVKVSVTEACSTVLGIGYSQIYVAKLN